MEPVSGSLPLNTHDHWQEMRSVEQRRQIEHRCQPRADFTERLFQPCMPTGRNNINNRFALKNTYLIEVLPPNWADGEKREAGRRTSNTPEKRSGFHYRFLRDVVLLLFSLGAQ
jgi:hypothetical protein